MERGLSCLLASFVLLLKASARRSGNWICQIALPSEAAVGLVAFASKSPATEMLEEETPA